MTPEELKSFYDSSCYDVEGALAASSTEKDLSSHELISASEENSQVLTRSAERVIDYSKFDVIGEAEVDTSASAKAIQYLFDLKGAEGTGQNPQQQRWNLVRSWHRQILGLYQDIPVSVHGRSLRETIKNCK